jgi:23S rRNA-/tRNA-specific pseudouridylate synthase
MFSYCVLLQVHRLDVNTGGLLLVAKTRAAGTALAADLAEHKMQKR